MGKTFKFWWMCAKRAARGSAAFANDWQWLLGFPILAAVISVANRWFGEGTVSLNTDTALGALEAAGAAFIITLAVGFVIRLFASASNFYYEEKDRANALQQQIDLALPRAEAKKLLQQCYIEICDLFNERILEDGVDQYIKRCYEIITKQAKTIETQLGVVARVKFLDRIGILDSVFSKSRVNKEVALGVGVNKVYNQILLELNRIKDNLDELLKSEFRN
ncbi:MAG: hypothetical protein M3178_01960 [Pseudomonadota bacterium]|nr:hypothetical protein [Pseudomonadota bacterium]